MSAHAGELGSDDAAVVGLFQDSVVVVPQAEAQRLATLNDALADASTWGEFLDALDLADARDVVERTFDGTKPDRDAAFAPEDVAGFADGDWPTWPAAQMLRWLPADVQQLGSVE